MHFASLKLLPFVVAAGLWHMDCDHQMLRDSQSDAQDVLRLRFYQWQPAALSLGAHQQHYPSCWHDLVTEEGMDLVHRPTGGRAVLHDGDLTYALACFGGDRPRRQIYHHLCQFLIYGFSQLGISLHFGIAGRSAPHHPSCFATATIADLVGTDGRKLIGSAQRYEHGWVLQHGSISLTANRDRHRRFFPNTEIPAGLSDRLTISPTALADTLTRAAQECFQIPQAIAIYPKGFGSKS